MHLVFLLDVVLSLCCSYRYVVILWGKRCYEQLIKFLCQIKLQFCTIQFVIWFVKPVQFFSLNIWAEDHNKLLHKCPDEERKSCPWDAHLLAHCCLSWIQEPFPHCVPKHLHCFRQRNRVDALDSENGPCEETRTLSEHMSVPVLSSY